MCFLTPQMMTSLVSLWETAPHIITPFPPKHVALSIAFNKSSPHFYPPTSTCHRQNSDSSLKYGPDDEGQSWQDSWQRPDIGCVQFVLDCLGREQSTILSWKPWLQICWRLLMFPKCWQGEEMLFLWCRHLGTPTSWPVSDIPCYMQLGLQFEDGTRALQIML